MAGSMEFWGVEVKAKEPCTVSLLEGTVVHISQATLGDIKKNNETVVVHVKVGDKKLVLGMLSQKIPQLSFDLVFEKEFEISHNWKNGSIHLMGYQTEMGELDSESEFGFSDEEEEGVPIGKENGLLVAPTCKAPAVKPKENKPKTAAKDESDDTDSSDSEDDDVSEDADDSDEDMVSGDSDSEGDEDDSEESEDEPTKVVDSGKKRPNADAKTPPQAKKAKIATPQKTDGKKGVGHPGTPHPNKKGGKTPCGDKTPKSGGVKSPKSGGSGSDVSCGPCKKTFKSESALQSHSKAKHAK